MVSELWAVLALALLDAVNPSALAVTIFLLLQGPGHPRRVVAYVAGILVVYLALGLLLWSGMALVLSAVGGLWSSTPGHVVQAVLGVGLAVYGFWPRRERAEGAEGGRVAKLRPGAGAGAGGGVATIFGLGMLVSLVESSTAAPYIAAVGIIGSSSLGPAASVVVLASYNLVMIAPPLLLMGLFAVVGDRLAARMQTWAGWLERQARETFYSIIGAVGVLLALNALRYFDTWLSS